MAKFCPNVNHMEISLEEMPISFQRKGQSQDRGEVGKEVEASLASSIDPRGNTS